MNAKTINLSPQHYVGQCQQSKPNLVIWTFGGGPLSILRMFIVKQRAVLGALAKLRDAIISFDTYVGPSVRMEQLGSHWTDIHEL